VLGVEAVGAAHDRLGQVRAERLLAARPARAQHVERDAPDDRRQPGAQILDLAPTGAAQPDPRLLHRVVGLADRAEHPVCDGAQVRAVRLEALGQVVALVHGHIPSSRSVSQVTDPTQTM
jgi:hypothetical protein